MLNEKHYDAFHWRTKLEDTDSLPDQRLIDKTVVWEKLQHRLHVKPNRAVQTRYWIAAAILLLLVLPFLFSKKNTSLVNQPNQSRRIFPAPATTSDNKNQAAIMLPVSAQNAAVLPGVKNVNNKVNAAIHPKEYEPSISNSFAKEKITSEINIVPLTTFDTATVITIATVAKTKLKVIHINELETSPDPMVSLRPHAQNNANIKFEKRINNTSPGGPGQSDYAGLFKIKL
jgi:hypothetical protein